MSLQIRNLFLNFFAERGHQIVPSSSLVPNNDPTLLFTNAGMVQFKDYLLDPSNAPMRRATTVQRCLRVGGKHNDLENVGYTARHHTFFEMLGNFSFGDYFKKEAIAYAWEFLTKTLKLSADRLYVTVYKDDAEAALIWEKEVGVAKDRIVPLGEKDNFWSMGDTGPCGPCSEILVDQGKEVGCRRPSCSVGCDCDRFLEIWNLVFMQYNRDASGKLTPLPKPCIDTGMGLERISAIVQEVKSNYQSDIFRNLIMRASLLLHTPYQNGQSEKDSSLHVIADHIRAIVFLLADGVTPANDGRGYVLRRILRRAMRHGRNLGASKPFLFEVADAVFHDMQEAYPYILSEKNRIQKMIREEEEQFLETLERGIKYLQEELANFKRGKEAAFSGRTAFHLYETYGFPVDLTEDILRSENVKLDRDSFEKAFAEHRQKAKGSWKAGENANAWLEVVDQQLAKKPLDDSRFSGYEKLTDEGKLLLILDTQGQPLTEAKNAGEYLLIFDNTPFYAESGGQVGDRGWILGNDLKLAVLDTQKKRKTFLHRVAIPAGQSAHIKTGTNFQLTVDASRRQLIARNHSLTHLLHAALYEILGEHIRQAGSYLDDQRLTFDFTHHATITSLQLRAIEKSLHEKIWSNLPLEVREMAYPEAIKLGAKAFFQEKYGDLVRVVKFGDLSTELCGGTHVPFTGEIGICRITAEHSVAAKTRRIELTSGLLALDQLQNELWRLKTMAETLKVSESDIESRLGTLLEEQKQLKLKLKESSQKEIGSVVDTIVAEASSLPHRFANFVFAQTSVDDLRLCADQVLEKIPSGIVALAGEAEGRALLVVKVTKDLTKKFSAAELVKACAAIIGGGGGGRPDMAQAGGSNPAQLKEAIEKIRQIVSN